MRNNHLFNGFHYLLRGASLLAHPKLRAFVLVPMVVNLILFVIATALLIQQFDGALSWIMGFVPDFLSFLVWLLWILFAAVILLIYGYSFSLITNLVAAPFYGLLAEKVEALETGTAPDAEPFSQMIPRTLLRELQKFWYFVVRSIGIGIVILVLTFIPGVNFLIPVIGLIWGAWSMAIQYADYAADNHQLEFLRLRQRLGDHLFSTYGFGGLVMVGTMVPLINIVVMPAAVAGGTLFWLEELAENREG